LVQLHIAPQNPKTPVNFIVINNLNEICKFRVHFKNKG